MSRPIYWSRLRARRPGACLVGEDRPIEIRHIADGILLRTFPAAQLSHGPLAPAPDGQTSVKLENLIFALDGQTLAVADPHGAIHLRRVSDSTLQGTLPHPTLQPIPYATCSLGRGQG